MYQLQVGAIILAPTRELALQVSLVAQRLLSSHFSSLRMVLLTSGKKTRKENLQSFNKDGIDFYFHNLRAYFIVQ